MFTTFLNPESKDRNSTKSSFLQNPNKTSKSKVSIPSKASKSSARFNDIDELKKAFNNDQNDIFSDAYITKVENEIDDHNSKFVE
eukprot:CAMPEP_0116896172 /NCGR_PEP_ID=MMETSP0467-20121206/5483_1 /TAXON_ID=283647 /ORGANISM="Mesodinium pulex, Strain SPMC105" /LENGTH=84 /DNA_ID=CAMNT_0004567211 /DNA_START=236 /DNA_END=490 /DNA_ORIENTATION=-